MPISLSAKSLTERPTTLPCVRTTARLDMELPNVAFSNTGPCVIILRGELVGPYRPGSPSPPPPLPTQSRPTPDQPIEF